MSMPAWIEGEREPRDRNPDRGRVWWVFTDAEPVVRVACQDNFSAVIADFPVPAAKQLRHQLDAAIHEAEATARPGRAEASR